MKTTKQDKPAWTGPRQWDPMNREDVMARLRKINDYRKWAKKEGLGHMVISRGEVENLVRQAGHEPTKDLMDLIEWD